MTRFACALFACIFTATFSGTRVREPALVSIRATTASPAIPAIPTDVAPIHGDHASGIVRLAQDEGPRTRQHHASGIASSANALVELKRLTGQGTVTHAHHVAQSEPARTYDANPPPTPA